MHTPGVPPRIADRVHETERGLTLVDGVTPDHGPVLGILGGTAVLGIAIVGWRVLDLLGIAALLRSVPVLPVASGALVVALALLVGRECTRWAREHKGALHVSPRRVTRTGLFASSVHLVHRLVLRGAPGRTIELASTHEVLGSLQIVPGSEEGWDYDSITWLGERVAALLEVPLEDQRSPEGWNRWLTDPQYRAELAFDRRIELNHRAYASHLREPEPPEHELDLRGMRVSLKTDMFSEVEIQITLDHLVCRGERIPLADIERIDVLLERRSNGKRQDLFGEIVLLVRGTGTGTLVDVKVEGNPSKVGQLRWLADTIRRQAAQATVPDLGSADEIPEALARQLQRRRATPSRPSS